jgi:hypothetical protein
VFYQPGRWVRRRSLTTEKSSESVSYCIPYSPDSISNSAENTSQKTTASVTVAAIVTIGRRRRRRRGLRGGLGWRRNWFLGLGRRRWRWSRDIPVEDIVTVESQLAVYNQSEPSILLTGGVQSDRLFDVGPGSRCEVE